jgi:hypothetical protein
MMLFAQKYEEKVALSGTFFGTVFEPFLRLLMT